MLRELAGIVVLDIGYLFLWISLTGGTGRIGANLAKQLLARGYEVRSFVFRGDASRAHKLDAYEAIETMVGDLRNYEDVQGAVQGVDAVYHLAAAFAGPGDDLSLSILRLSAWCLSRLSRPVSVLVDEA